MQPYPGKKGQGLPTLNLAASSHQSLRFRQQPSTLAFPPPLVVETKTGLAVAIQASPLGEAPVATTGKGNFTQPVKAVLSKGHVGPFQLKFNSMKIQ